MSWSYSNINAWKNIAPVSWKGTNQSPIELTEKVEKIPTFKSPLNFINYHEEPLRVYVKNSGHDIRLVGHWKRCQPYVSGLCIDSNATYNFHNAHVHWSTQNTNGTEHSINQRKYAIELHLVHFNSKYESIAEATKHGDGLVVVGILFKVNDNAFPNQGMRQLSRAAEMLQKPGSKVKFRHAFDLSSFVPNPVRSIYSYDGSLTRPPCTENVRWIILSRVQTVTSEIMNEFRKVELESGCRSNVRPLQPLNERVVENYTHLKNVEDL